MSNFQSTQKQQVLSGRGDVHAHTIENKILSSLLQSVPLNIYAKNIDGQFIFVNAEYCRNSGKDAHDILGKSDYDIHPPELADKYRADDQQIIKSGEVRTIEEPRQSIGGEKRYVEVIKSPLRDNENPDKIIGTIGVFWDITQRKTVEKQVLEDRNFLRTIIDTIPSLVYTKDTQGCFTTANKAIADFVGVDSPDDLIGKDDSDFFPAEAADDFSAKEKKFFESGIALDNLMETYQYKGKEYTINTTKKPLYDLDGNLEGLVGVGHDITKIKQLEKEREKLIAELRVALDEVKTLRGLLLPICSSCKKIRDDKGYWNEVESYISHHSDAQFTHGICPDCIKKNYPDIYEELEQQGGFLQQSEEKEKSE